MAKHAAELMMPLARPGTYTHDAGLVEEDMLDEETRARGRDAAAQAERGENPPSWVTDEDTWERAKEAVRKRWAEYDEPWAVVTYVYQQMGGGIG